MQNATDEERSDAYQAHVRLSFNEQMYAIIKRLEAENKAMREKIAALEKQLSALETWADSHRSNHASTAHLRYGGGFGNF